MPLHSTLSVLARGPGTAAAPGAVEETDPLELVGLTPLMKLTRGTPEIMIALIDGPVATTHPDLSRSSIREVPGSPSGACSSASSAACAHGTSVAGVLSAKRGSRAPAICPMCTLLVYPIFAEAGPGAGQLPTATPGKLAEAVIRSVDSGAHLINLSVALARPSSREERELQAALDYASRHEVITVAAAGNQGAIGSSSITRHPWVLPVVACDLRGMPLARSNFGKSIGRRGLRAPGRGVTSLGVGGEPVSFGGTSAAAPFVTGALALLWSTAPDATARTVRSSVADASKSSRATVIPPLMDAWAAYRGLKSTRTAAGGTA